MNSDDYENGLRRRLEDLEAEKARNQPQVKLMRMVNAYLTQIKDRQPPEVVEESIASARNTLHELVDVLPQDFVIKYGAQIDEDRRGFRQQVSDGRYRTKDTPSQ